MEAKGKTPLLIAVVPYVTSVMEQWKTPMNTATVTTTLYPSTSVLSFDVLTRPFWTPPSFRHDVTCKNLWFPPLGGYESWTVHTPWSSSQLFQRPPQLPVGTGPRPDLWVVKHTSPTVPVSPNL